MAFTWTTRKIILSLIIVSFIMIGVIFAVNKWTTPDTPAFQDQFTREFLLKDGEAPEGFHLFESGTGKYTMIFPDNYVIEKESYYRKKGRSSGVINTENIYLRLGDTHLEKNKLLKGIKLFLKPDGNVLIDADLKILLEQIDAPSDTKIETIKDDNKTVYYAENIDNYEAEGGNINTNFFLYGFITDNHSKQSLYFNLRQKCFDSSEKCEIDFDKEKAMALKMLESIQFK
ncbi:hypothetical protein H1Z61_07085 [Bacillus aquiflavi]|uniref:Uncharacterized protein n=1 Tax=Bacillus aquiflavi TaxID=2672567 RepID=A0A6B3VVI9_9BACI|nr:hypothetical protein [Bacillus aquiflavi]MBA4536911.1 hypothetical protein [Bacillus aquiflavi]NEY81278.1 hypothetical protein [Bacillus aquiflavi]